jgi:hypothetical protein
MRTLVYILMGLILIALAKEFIAAHKEGSDYRASHRMISDARPSQHWTARI